MFDGDLTRGLVDSAIEWADGLGYLGLAILTSTEAALQPIPPDPLVWNMILDAENGFVVATVVMIATISSVLGALAGYAIGMYGGGWLLERFVSQSTITRLNVLVDRYGSAGIFIAAVSPIPYKALAWIAGAGRMDCVFLLQQELLEEVSDLEFQVHYWEFTESP